MPNIVPVTDANFEEVVLKNNRPVIVAIGASWCVDCRRAAPFYMQFSDTYADRGVFCSCDSEANKAVMEKFEVKHIPTMVVVKNGAEVARIVEVKTPAALKEFIETNL